MNTSLSTIPGLIEYRGRVIAAHVPASLLVLDAMSYALARSEHNRVEALDPDYTPDERATLMGRADALDKWVDDACEGTVPFGVDVFLFERSGFDPVVVMRGHLDAYIGAILSVSTVVPMESLCAPQFAVRNNGGEAELWLTESISLRTARLHPGPDVQVVTVTTDDLKALIASQRMPRMFATTAMFA